MLPESTCVVRSRATLEKGRFARHITKSAGRPRKPGRGSGGAGGEWRRDLRFQDGGQQLTPAVDPTRDPADVLQLLVPECIRLQRSSAGDPLAGQNQNATHQRASLSGAARNPLAGCWPSCGRTWRTWTEAGFCTDRAGRAQCVLIVTVHVALGAGRRGAHCV